MTFSLLPDCLAARLPGTLEAVEHVVAVAERAPSLAAAAEALRPDPIGLPGAMRWVRRRVRRVHRVLAAVRGLWPERLSGCPAEVLAVRGRLQTDMALTVLRGRLPAQLPALPAPLGFYPHREPPRRGRTARQHTMGPDPPRPRP